MSFGHMTVIYRPNKLRILAIMAGLLISVPLFGVAFFSGNSFFARASDEIPRDVVVTSLGKTEATISWTTDRSTQSVIEYGTTPTELTTYAPEVKSTKDHHIELTFLTSSTTYYFQIRVGNNVYDNGGVPWSFTTRSMTGEEPIKQVKGINTKLTGIPDKSKISSTSATLQKCDATDCEEVKSMLGKGCSSSDYIQCLSGGGKKSTSSGTTTNTTTRVSTPYPTPTSIMIVSNMCQLQYLQTGNTCMTWTWDNFDTKPYVCREAFDRYILQCKNKSFEGPTDDSIATIWYYNSAISHIATNSATFNVTPASGSTVYCQLRVEDEIGGESHSTRWLRAQKKCE